MDDDLVLARSLARQLADICPVAIAEDIGRAREIARRQRFVAALIDYHLGEASGTTLANQLTDSTLSSIVIMTADRRAVVAEEVLDGGYLLLYKPMDGAQLRDTLVLATSSVDAVRGRVAAWLVRQGVEGWAAENTAAILCQRSSADAARSLSRSKHTMRDYIRPCLDITGARNKTELLQAFLGLIDLSGGGPPKN